MGNEKKKKIKLFSNKYGNFYKIALYLIYILIEARHNRKENKKMDDKTKKALEDAEAMMSSMFGMSSEELLKQQEQMAEQLGGALDMQAMMSTAQSMMQDYGQISANMQAMALEANQQILDGTGPWSELAAQTMQNSESLFGSLDPNDMLSAMLGADDPVLEPEQLKAAWNELSEQLKNSEIKVVPQSHEAWHSFEILLSGFLSNLNGYELDTLQVADTDFEKEMIRDMLPESWGIENREDLLSTMQNLLDQGHTGEYAYYVECCATQTQPELEDEESINRYEFTKQYSELMKPDEMLSWDYGRAAMMVRWGYTLGYLSEQESWDWLNQIAEVTCATYTSWKGFGLGYLFGSLFWMSAFDPEEGVSERFYQGKQALLELFDEEGEWHNSIWLQQEA